MNIFYFVIVYFCFVFVLFIALSPKPHIKEALGKAIPTEFPNLNNEDGTGHVSTL